MKYCVNHGGRVGNHKCKTCGNPICYECFNKYLIVNDRIKIGFCSEICRTMYLQRIKEYKAKNRRKALKFFVFGLLAIGMGFLTIGIFFYFFGDSETAHIPLNFLVHRIVDAFWVGGAALIIYSFLALFKGVDPDIYT